MTVEIFHNDCLRVLKTLRPQTIDLVYIDPPFNTGRTQQRKDLKYDDKFPDLSSYLFPRVMQIFNLLTPNGSLFVHLDQREVHYIKIMLDKIFGRESFINEIIWAYDYGGRSKNMWPQKHNTILWYALNPKDYIFNYDEIDRIAYMAPGLVGKEKAALGKTPTDVWWNTIVHTNGSEKTGYPTQKPLAILERIVKVHSNPGSLVMDCFAGSGTTGHAAINHGRHAVLIDKNRQAIDVMLDRFQGVNPIVY